MRRLPLIVQPWSSEMLWLDLVKRYLPTNGMLTKKICEDRSPHRANWLPSSKFGYFCPIVEALRRRVFHSLTHPHPPLWLPFFRGEGNPATGKTGSAFIFAKPFESETFKKYWHPKMTTLATVLYIPEEEAKWLHERKFRRAFDVFEMLETLPNSVERVFMGSQGSTDVCVSCWCSASSERQLMHYYGTPFTTDGLTCIYF